MLGGRVRGTELVEEEDRVWVGEEPLLPYWNGVLRSVYGSFVTSFSDFDLRGEWKAGHVLGRERGEREVDKLSSCGLCVCLECGGLTDAGVTDESDWNPRIDASVDDVEEPLRVAGLGDVWVCAGVVHGFYGGFLRHFGSLVSLPLFMLRFDLNNYIITYGLT